MDSINNPETVYKRLPPLWMGLKALRSLKEIIFFTIFLSVVSTTRFSPFSFDHVKWIIAAYGIYKVISIVLEWKHFGYFFDNEGLHIKSGRFIKMNRHIPYQRIQGINEYTPFFHRLLGLTILLLDLGTNDKKSSVKLDMLTKNSSEEIKDSLIKYGSIPKDNVNIEENEQGVITKEHPLRKTIYRISNKEIVIGSVTSLKLILFFTLLYSVYGNVERFFSVELNVERVVSYFTSSWWLTSLGIVTLIVISTAYGVLKTYLRYGDFSVASDQHRIYINKGRVNTTDFSIPKNKIQAVSIKYSLLYKLTGLVKVRLISTNDSDNQEVQTSNVLFPFINEKKARSLIGGMLPEFRVHESITTVPKKSIIPKLMRTFYLWLAAIAAVYLYLPSFWYIAFVFVSYTLISQIRSGLFSGYSFEGDSIQLKKCRLSSSVIITSRSRLEELRFSQTLMQRMFGLSSLTMVSRSNPAKTTRMWDVPFKVSMELYTMFKEDAVRKGKLSA
ncbi:PH domain-containing protein [Terribacillus saccharophilus]|uniref:PH domain-containing protein n=1 Tax=Terribacillus saccharophilus TaxID=361277 RepID=UPI0037F9E352